MATTHSLPFRPTGDLVIDAMTNGFVWTLGANREIRWGLANGFNGESFSSGEFWRGKFEPVFSSISDIANVRFSYAGYFSDPISAHSAGVDISISLDARNIFFSSSGEIARAFFPASSNRFYTGEAGDVYLNLNSSARTYPYDIGTQGFFLMLHEVGHSLGLKHPHDSGGTGRPTFSQQGFGNLDIDWNTVMSYNDDADFDRFRYEPTSPMLLDALALQYLYGPNRTTNAGDTTYSLVPTNRYTTWWDAGGFDTINASASSEGWFIALPNASFSSLIDSRVGNARLLVDENILSNTSGRAPRDIRWLLGDMENVIGSPHADYIKGNLFANNLSGGLGNDTLEGLDGDDVFIAGGGNDQVIGGAGNDRIFGNEGDDLLIDEMGRNSIDGGAGNDSIAGGSGDDLIFGGAGNDGLFGGDSGNDTIDGGAGDDVIRLHAGNETIFGGDGIDKVFFRGDFAATAIVYDAATETFRFASGTDGVDRVSGVELFAFRDRTMNVFELLDRLDNTPPVIALGTDRTVLAPGQTAHITFTLSESSSDFTAGDVAVSGGMLSGFSGSGRHYTASFTLGLSGISPGFVAVRSGAFSDASGNANADGADPNNSLTFGVATAPAEAAPGSISLANLFRVYMAYFGRPPDPTGLGAFRNASEADVISAFSSSRESRDLLAGSSVATQVNSIYRNLFGRDAEPAGLDFWVREVEAGRVSLARAAFTIQSAALNSDALTVAAKSDVMEAFVARLFVDPAIGQNYSGNQAAQLARQFLSGVKGTTATELAANKAAALLRLDTAINQIVAAGGGAIRNTAGEDPRLFVASASEADALPPGAVSDDMPIVIVVGTSEASPASS